MRSVSLFSGCGGLDLGLERAGFKSVIHCEINPHAAAVLRYHWPDTPIWDDVTTFNGEEYDVELVHGGSPCQNMSIAGGRAGLAGEESRLYWHQIRIWRETSAEWLLWENVAGALSSNGGADFAAVLWGITGALPDVPPGGWRKWGFITGPLGCAVWRLLDARWFGVPQRRRRIFVVGNSAGNLASAIKVLLEPPSSAGNLEQGRSPQQGASSAAQTSIGECLARRRGHGDYTLDDISSTLRVRAGDGTSTDLIPFHLTQTPIHGDDSFTPTISKGNPSGSCTIGVAYPLAMRGRQDGAHLEMGESDIYNTLRAGNGGSSRSNTVLTPQLAVRRLMPVECERLMSWPDNHTHRARKIDGSVYRISDSHRYAMCGNGVVSNQAEWIGDRLANEIAP